VDLLEYAQGLVSRGHTSHNAHVVQLQSLIQEKQPEIKTEIKSKANNSQVQPKSPSFNAFYLVGGLVLFGAAILAIGYWLGKRKSQPKLI